MTRVLKFGGAALADGGAVRSVCDIVASQQARDGATPVLVVSAHAGVTDQLEELGRDAAGGGLDAGPVRVRHRGLLRQLDLPSDLLDRYWRALSALLAEVSRRGRLEPAELDRVLSFGERLSARVVARALEQRGISATPVDAWDLGLVTDSRHGRAKPLEGVGDEIAQAIHQVPGVPVVTGFLAKDVLGQLTTLGRNGSDLTAAILAESIGASELIYWKTVPGILTADPSLIAAPRLLDQITYAEAGELAFHGAKVLHPAAVLPARRARVPVRVASVHEPGSAGTVLVEERRGRGACALAVRDEALVVRLAVESPERRGACTARLFGALEACGVTPWLTGAEDGLVWALVEPGPEVPGALGELGGSASLERDIATLALVGEGAGSDPDLGRMALEGLAAAGVRSLRSTTTDRALVHLVRADQRLAAAQALHALLPAGARAQN